MSSWRCCPEDMWHGKLSVESFPSPLLSAPEIFLPGSYPLRAAGQQASKFLSSWCDGAQRSPTRGSHRGKYSVYF